MRKENRREKANDEEVSAAVIWLGEVVYPKDVKVDVIARLP